MDEKNIEAPLNETRAGGTPESDTQDTQPSTHPTAMQLLTVALTVGARRYRQQFVAPVPPENSLGDDEVDWLKGYFLATGYAVEGVFLSPRGDWEIEEVHTITPAETGIVVEFGPVGTPLCLEEDKEDKGDTSPQQAEDLDEEGNDEWEGEFVFTDEQAE